MSARPIRPAALAIVVAVAALDLSGCRDKSSATAPDGGDSALVARPRESGDGDAGDGGDSTDGGEARADASLPLEDLVLPQPSSAELLARMRHLLEAVAQNNPELASDVLFPRDAFIATHDAEDPQTAWEKRLSNAFRRAVERSHKRTKGIENARFVGFELGHTVVQGTPKKHEWKRPLWKVKHSRLSFTIEGKVRHLDIAEMTAWRGAWYITRLR